MEKRLIYLSPSSHGVGANRGIEDGCYEDGHTRPIAEETKKQLESTGRFVVVIAKSGTSMAERCAESDRLGADLHVPIHTNASSNKNVRYLMFMFYADNEEYRKLFDAVPNKHNGITLCTGSLGAGRNNDMVKMASELADRSYFVHLRQITLSGDHD